MVEIANLCLQVDNKNEVIHSKDGVVKTIRCYYTIKQGEPPNDLWKKGKIEIYFVGRL